MERVFRNVGPTSQCRGIAFVGGIVPSETWPSATIERRTEWQPKTRRNRPPVLTRCLLTENGGILDDPKLLNKQH